MAGYQGTATRKDQHEGLASHTEAERRDTYTTIPGKIVEYDATRQKAKIQPLLKGKFGDKELEAPVIEEVPVSHARGAGHMIHVPLGKDDEVNLHFSKRNLDKTLDDGSHADPYPGRMHDLSDAIAVPSGLSKPKEQKDMPKDRIHIGSEDGKHGLQVKKDGTFDHTKGGDTLYKIMQDFITAVRDHTNANAPVDDKSPFNQLLTRVGKMKTD